MEKMQEWAEALYRQHWNSTYKAAYRLLENRALAEEAAQDAFAVLLEKYDSLRDHEDLKGWLARTAANLAANERRRACYHLEVPLNTDEKLSVEDAYFRGLSSSFPPGLSEKDRELLIMCYDACLPQEEAAARLGCSLEAFRMRLSRAKSRCRKLMEENSSDSCYI